MRKLSKNKEWVIIQYHLLFDTLVLATHTNSICCKMVPSWHTSTTWSNHLTPRSNSNRRSFRSTTPSAPFASTAATLLTYSIVKIHCTHVSRTIRTMSRGGVYCQIWIGTYVGGEHEAIKLGGGSHVKSRLYLLPSK